ncbi:hypothetical protein M514_03029, partial [Trichuris suis]
VHTVRLHYFLKLHAHYAPRNACQVKSHDAVKLMLTQIVQREHTRVAEYCVHDAQAAYTVQFENFEVASKSRKLKPRRPLEARFLQTY